MANQIITNMCLRDHFLSSAQCVMSFFLFFLSTCFHFDLFLLYLFLVYLFPVTCCLLPVSCLPLSVSPVAFFQHPVVLVIVLPSPGWHCLLQFQLHSHGPAFHRHWATVARVRASTAGVGFLPGTIFLHYLVLGHKHKALVQRNPENQHG